MATPPMSTMDRIAHALGRLGEVTEAVQNISVGVVHVANQHEVIGKAAGAGAAQLGRVADAAVAAGVGIAQAAMQGAQAVERMAGAAERVAAVVEAEAPQFRRALERAATQR